MVLDAAVSWQDRPADLKAIDASRTMAPDWFQSNRTLGGVCYVDLYAGNLAGLRKPSPTSGNSA
jgi:amylosucrase